MSGLPSVHRWYAEDYPNSDEDFKRFLGQLNLFADPVYQILNGGVGISENTLEEIYILEIPTAGALFSDNTFLFTPKKFVGAPHGVLIGQCIFNTNTGIATAVGAPVTLDWAWTGSQISILAVYGLTVGQSYSLSLRIY